MVWYSHLLKNFPQFVVLHTVKGFSVVSEAEVDVFLELSCFFYDPTDVGNVISGSSAFSKYSLNIWKFSVHVLLKRNLGNFEHYFARVWDECDCAVVWTFFGTAFFWDWDENWPFPVLWPLLSFPNLLAYWTQHFNNISFFGVEVAQMEFCHLHWLALFIVMFPNTQLTSYLRMSGSRWVITSSWLSGSLRYFLYSSVYSCRLLISSASASCVANKELASRLDKELSVRKGCGCVLSHFTLTVCDPMDCNPPGDYLQSEGGRQAIWGHRCHCPHRPHVCFCLGHCGSHWAGEEVD